ncbi:efflux RND transporter periplasmic adaptor subunit [Psychrobium sp. MM17-31]|uniref:efflux RND transporter periplasmic adaptor subunit n=1 Tax=Psychrobium sp. MM17-31 TaxID=2917758 RepID=UPI001EF50504|nr:efflux RND transporter periplasmic adaptor subunit [Psychrobium sp. MM17-31]MCG7530559.1 efflux RND transporter periplasmic adaptor subunit [Psychrobium sp. MM17-31]
MNKFVIPFITLVIGVVLGIFMMPMFSDKNMASDETAVDKPLYWVAPMDANYRRDEPGLSPMGMELVPVYAEDAAEDDAGVVSISPVVVNNLGVKTAKVEHGTLMQHINATGAIEFNNESRVVINPRVAGWVEKLHVKTMGDKVEKGQPLYDFYSPDLVNAQEELLLAQSQKSRRLIIAATKRLEALLVPKRVIEQLKRGGKVKNHITMLAPASGVIEAINVSEGSYIMPSKQLLTIVDLGEVWANIDVFESQASWLKVGDMAEVRVAAFPTKVWQGSVDTIYPMLDGDSRTLRLRLRIANDDELLRPNMFAKVTMHVRDDDMSFLVPNNAVIRTGKNNRVVMALGEGRFKSVAVELGQSNGEQVQVISGLAMDDEVVTSAQFLIDSESNINSDLKRYQGNDEEQAQALRVWADATINRVMAGHEMLNVTHGAIAQWNWPEMTMNFYIDESLNIDDFSAGQKLQIEIMEDDEGDYIITDVKAMAMEHHHHD